MTRVLYNGVCHELHSGFDIGTDLGEENTVHIELCISITELATQYS